MLALQALVPAITKGSYSTVTEGSEPAEFWAALGGKGPYASSKVLEEPKYKEPRLFQCTNAVGMWLSVSSLFRLYLA